MNPTRLGRFPFKLHNILEDAEKDGNQSVVTWLPHGRAFRVNRKDIFVQSILPKYFRQSKYKSFQRQLNLWGFESIRCGDLKNAIFHRYFIRGCPEMCHYMTRTKIKGSSVDTALCKPRQVDAPLTSSIPSQLSAVNTSQAIDFAHENMVLSRGSLSFHGLPTAFPSEILTSDHPTPSTQIFNNELWKKNIWQRSQILASDALAIMNRGEGISTQGIGLASYLELLKQSQTRQRLNLELELQHFRMNANQS